MSHARPSFAAVALLLAAIGALPGCGSGDDTQGGSGSVRVADTRPCDRLTPQMAERVLQSPKLEESEAGEEGCSILASSTIDKKSGQRDATLSLGALQVPARPAKKGDVPPAKAIAEWRKEADDDEDYTVRDLPIGTDGFVSVNDDLQAAQLAWNDGDVGYVLDYNAWMSPQPGKVPVDDLIAIAREIAS